MEGPRFFWELASASEDEALARAEAPAGLLGPEEAAVLAGLTFRARRAKWLVGRLAAKRLLRRLLREERGLLVDSHTLTVANEPSGAPYVLLEGQRLPWAISLSHREPWGVCAVSTEPGARLGVDLELPLPRDRALVRTFFTEREQERVEAASSGEVDRVVAQVWSIKEAVLKALGLGLRLDTREVEVGQETGERGDGWSGIGVRLVGDAARHGGTPQVLFREQPGRALAIALLPLPVQPIGQP